MLSYAAATITAALHLLAAGDVQGAITVLEELRVTLKEYVPCQSLKS